MTSDIIFVFYCSVFFHSETYVGKLLDALIGVSVLEKKSLVTEATFLNLKDCDFLFKPDLYLKTSRAEKSFRHLKSTAQVDLVNEILTLLANYSNSTKVMNHLTEKEKVQTSAREVILLLNQLIKGTNIKIIFINLLTFH